MVAVGGSGVAVGIAAGVAGSGVVVGDATATSALLVAVGSAWSSAVTTAVGVEDGDCGRVAGLLAGAGTTAAATAVAAEVGAGDASAEAEGGGGSGVEDASDSMTGGAPSSGQRALWLAARSTWDSAASSPARLKTDITATVPRAIHRDLGLIAHPLPASRGQAWRGKI